MALSDRDQSRLREIEEHTRATDPDFVTRLDLAGVLRRRRQLRRMCWWLQALGAWITLMGLSAAHGVISIGALVAGGGCALMVWSALTARRFASFDTTPLRNRFADRARSGVVVSHFLPDHPRSRWPGSRGFCCLGRTRVRRDRR